MARKNEDRPSLLDAWVRIGKLPDGRWAAENAQDLRHMTAEDLDHIVAALSLWYEAHRWKLRARGQ